MTACVRGIPASFVIFVLNPKSTECLQELSAELHIFHVWVEVTTKPQLLGFYQPFSSCSTLVPAAVPAPPPATIFIPSRGTVLQAMGPLPVRPPVPVHSSLPALAPIPPRPPQPHVPGSVRCSGCSKVLMSLCSAHKTPLPMSTFRKNSCHDCQNY